MTDVPSLKFFLHPVLAVLSEAEAPLSRGAVREQVLDRMELSEEQRRVLIPSGKYTKVRHRAGWAMTELKQMDLAERSGDGWSITAAGQALVREHPDALPDAVIAELRREVRARRKAEAAYDAIETTEAALAQPDEDIDPEEAIDRALRSLRETVAAELLERLRGVDPYFFEKVVLPGERSTCHRWMATILTNDHGVAGARAP